mmetsp:Transcript_4685/g.7238  ORF Transcript_4685/g.7238 Transcript_4685/m.7238 type:complete len:597 (+) Transcript_4685:38-1828(+)
MVCSAKNDKRPLLGGLLVAFCTLEGGHALVAPPLLSTRLQHHRSSGNGAIKPTEPTLSFNLNGGVIVHNCIGQQHQSSNYAFRSASVRRNNVALRSSSTSTSDDATSTTQETEAPVSITMIVGMTSALVGYCYCKCLGIGFNLLWRQFPKTKLSNGIPASKHILCMMTLGGAIVATLSTLLFPTLFSAHDYVHVLSKESNDSDDENTNKMDKFPGIKYMFPLLGLSLITSISGFSLGPEAPMVGAGSLVGVNLGRMYIKSKEKRGDSSGINVAKLEETLAYAGAAGALTGALNFPLAGPIFALEFTSRRAGLAGAAGKNWNTAMMASLAGLAAIRGLIVPSSHVGGHFTYSAKAAIGVLHGREMVLAGLGMGVCGALVGTCFHKSISFLKNAIWSKNKSSSKAVVIGKKVLLAMLVGYISTLFPQTMFWGEPSMQCVIDGQCTPFSATPHGLPAAMMQAARVNPNEPFASGSAALQVGLAKFSAIVLASAAKFPGGVIFPLLSNGASLGHALVSALGPILPKASSSLVPPTMIMSFMASLLTSITRTPAASVLILAFTASGITPLSVLLPGVLMASYVSVWVSEQLSKDSFFSYSE